MDIYITSLALGGVGLVAMAISGGSAHAGAHGAHAAHEIAPHSIHAVATEGLLSLLSPRVLFSICLGLGTAGLLVRGPNDPKRLG